LRTIFPCRSEKFVKRVFPQNHKTLIAAPDTDRPFHSSIQNLAGGLVEIGGRHLGNDGNSHFSLHLPYIRKVRMKGIDVNTLT
jgi:hypothetical protein